MPAVPTMVALARLDLTSQGTPAEQAVRAAVLGAVATGQPQSSLSSRPSDDQGLGVMDVYIPLFPSAGNATLLSAEDRLTAVLGVARLAISLQRVAQQMLATQSVGDRQSTVMRATPSPFPLPAPTPHFHHPTPHSLPLPTAHSPPHSPLALPLPIPSPHSLRTPHLSSRRSRTCLWALVPA
jgi:hypothetical protein